MVLRFLISAGNIIKYNLIELCLVQRNITVSIWNAYITAKANAGIFEKLLGPFRIEYFTEAFFRHVQNK